MGVGWEGGSGGGVGLGIHAAYSLQCTVATNTTL